MIFRRHSKNLRAENLSTRCPDSELSNEPEFVLNRDGCRELSSNLCNRYSLYKIPETQIRLFQSSQHQEKFYGEPDGTSWSIAYHRVVPRVNFLNSTTMHQMKFSAEYYRQIFAPDAIHTKFDKHRSALVKRAYFGKGFLHLTTRLSNYRWKAPRHIFPTQPSLHLLISPRGSSRYIRVVASSRWNLSVEFALQKTRFHHTKIFSSSNSRKYVFISLKSKCWLRSSQG